MSIPTAPWWAVALSQPKFGLDAIKIEWPFSYAQFGLVTASHYLHQCWLIISLVSFKWAIFHREYQEYVSKSWLQNYRPISQGPMSHHPGSRMPINTNIIPVWYHSGLWCEMLCDLRSLIKHDPWNIYSVLHIDQRLAQVGGDQVRYHYRRVKKILNMPPAPRDTQIPQCIRWISHNAPFCNRNVHTCAHFCYKMVHCGIWNRGIV